MSGTSQAMRGDPDLPAAEAPDKGASYPVVEPTAVSERFPSSDRRKVEKLPAAQSQLLYAFLLVYLAGTLVATPFLGRLNWYKNGQITSFGTIYCIGLLLIPVIGYWVGYKLLDRCVKVSQAAEKIDARTQNLLNNEAALRDRFRTTLLADYDQLAVDVPIVNAVRADALRRAMVDRWEPASWLVDAYWSELSSGLTLISTLQRMALQLGILFTFVGLAVAFSTLDLGSGSDDIPKQLVAALQVKFMSSIAGLVASISLLGLGWACRRELERAVSRLEAMADNILTLAKTLNNDTQFNSDITMLRDSVMAVEKRVEGLTQGYREVVTTVKGGIHELIMARSELEEKLTAVMATHRDVVAEINTFYARLSPQGLSEHLAAVLNDSMKTFSQRLADSAEALAAMKDAVDRLASAERVRATDDKGEAERHRELLNAIRQLAVQPSWLSGGGKGGSAR